MCKCPCNQTSFIANPNQEVFPFPDTRFPEAYEDGYQTGVNWDANWMPGGPFVYGGRSSKEVREASEAKARTWHEGFNNGLKVRLETNAHFAAWWAANRGKGGYQSYIDPCQEQAA